MLSIPLYVPYLDLNVLLVNRHFLKFGNASLKRQAQLDFMMPAKGPLLDQDIQHQHLLSCAPFLRRLDITIWYPEPERVQELLNSLLIICPSVQIRIRFTPKNEKRFQELLDCLSSEPINQMDIKRLDFVHLKLNDSAVQQIAKRFPSVQETFFTNYVSHGQDFGRNLFKRHSPDTFKPSALYASDVSFFLQDFARHPFANLSSLCLILKRQDCIATNLETIFNNLPTNLINLSLIIPPSLDMPWHLFRRLTKLSELQIDTHDADNGVMKEASFEKIALLLTNLPHSLVTLSIATCEMPVDSVALPQALLALQAPQIAPNLEWLHTNAVLSPALLSILEERDISYRQRLRATSGWFQ